MIPKTRTDTFRVRSYECDPRRKATIQTVANYLQEIAWRHARELHWDADDVAALDLAWVLARLHIRMAIYPTWGEQVQLITWPSGMTRVFAFRDFTMTGEQGDVCGRAASAWVLVDIKRRRPSRVPESFKEMMQERERAIDDRFDSKLELPDDMPNEVSFRVRLSDLDVNGHVNNVNFIEWAVEAVPADVRSKAQLAELQVEFHAESVEGDEVISRIAPGADAGAYLHRLERRQDSRTLAVMRTVWV